MSAEAKTGWQLAQEGMELSYAHAKQEWKAAALEAVFRAACDLGELTADDVWARFPSGFEKSNGSALGHVMRQAKSYGWIETTGEFRFGSRPVMHCKPLPVWKSLVGDEL